VTMDDGRQKPALYKQYDFGYDNMVAVTWVHICTYVQVQIRI
jgi:hypothetical protein